MCGICGIINTKFNDRFPEQVNRMVTSLQHRGPDSNGSWMSENKQVLFGHTRLSIIDLDQRSAQPFLSHDKRFSITYNGEIYNYLELKEECIKKGSRFITESDTEVVIECYRHWGVDCFPKFKGMWAVVIYDTHNHQICISRDFFGIKPLFYAIQNGAIYFASELKAFRSLGGLFAEEDAVTTKLFLDHGILDRGNWTFYKHVKRFPHVSYAIIDLSKTITELKFNIYWNPFEKSFRESLRTEKEAIAKFRDLFINSVKLHCRSDVEVGSCLSGGLDSSSIVAIATRFNSKFSTFTTRFPEFPDIDESQPAKLISDKYNTTQFYTEPTYKDFENEFDHILACQDEPYGSTSIFSQYMVFKKISEEGVKVILDGQGSDEALGGYISLSGIAMDTHFERGSYFQWLTESIQFSRNHNINYFKGFTHRILKKLLRRGTSSPSLSYDRLVGFKDYESYEERLYQLVSPSDKNIDDYLLYLVFDGNLQQLLRYEDRNSMNFSIESRVPFLEPDLVSFVCQMPFHYKFKNGFTKSILRKAFKDELPSEILWQKNKLGFASPEQSILKKVFNIDVQTNGSSQWRELIVNSWRQKNIH